MFFVLVLKRYLAVSEPVHDDGKDIRVTIQPVVALGRERRGGQGGLRERLLVWVYQRLNFDRISYLWIKHLGQHGVGVVEEGRARTGEDPASNI